MSQIGGISNYFTELVDFQEMSFSICTLIVDLFMLDEAILRRLWKRRPWKRILRKRCKNKINVDRSKFDEATFWISWLKTNIRSQLLQLRAVHACSALVKLTDPKTISKIEMILCILDYDSQYWENGRLYMNGCIWARLT